MTALNLEQATFELAVVKMQTFEPTYDPIATPIRAAADLIDYVVQGLDAFSLKHDEIRVNNNQYGINVLGALPVRCAEICREMTADGFLRAFCDARTYDFTLHLLARGSCGLAEKYEEHYGIAVEHLSATPATRLVHLEQDGSFFSMQPTDRERLGSHQSKRLCAYRQYMHPTSIRFAQRMAGLGIIGAILGKGL
jgi:hypothetical protein